MNKELIIGIDLGGTNLRAGLVSGASIQKEHTEKVIATADAGEIGVQLFSVIDKLFTKEVVAIGIGIPGLVDEDRGMVLDLVYIPAWKEYPLRQQLTERYQVPVLVNNDANCFALGEYYFGKGKDSQMLVGITIGTGLGSGIIANGKLVSGKYCGAGEFGMIDYLDKNLEYYCSGQFFSNVYGMDGDIVFEEAKKGNKDALKMYSEFGDHLGHALRLIMYALAPDAIILGGSVRQAWPYFHHSLEEQLESYFFRQVADSLKFERSELKNAGILGAAALYYDSLKNTHTGI